MWKDAVLICLISAGSTLLSEGFMKNISCSISKFLSFTSLNSFIFSPFLGISYLLIYRKPAYQQLKEKIEKSYKLTQKMLHDGSDEKIRIKLEKEMKRDNTALSGMRIYSLIFFSILMFGLFQYLKSTYNGIVIAKLPLIPYSLITRMTHSGLNTNDITDCGFVS